MDTLSLVLDAFAPIAGRRLLDVGCGPGGLTTELAERLGPPHVAAVDPSPPFAAACAARLPGVDVRVAAASGVLVTVAILLLAVMDRSVGLVRRMAG